MGKLDMAAGGMEIYLGLGSNLGDRRANILRAIDLLDDAIGSRFSSLSSLVETKPWGFDSESDFINAVVLYRTEVPDDKRSFAHELLGICKMVESVMGRTDAPEYDKAGKRIYHSRIIDIDILFCGDVTVNDSVLCIPHPMMKEREFVMKPLSEIASAEIKRIFPHIFIGK